MKFSRIIDGHQPITLASLTLFLVLLSYSFIISNLYYILPFIIFIFLFNLFFFRNPHRTIQKNHQEILAPADGRVYETDEKNGIIRIRMSLLNIHVNRSPVKGKITNIRKIEGTYWPFLSFIKRGTKTNARQIITMKTELGDIKIIQISGFLVRRCIAFVSEEEVEQGQIIGMIKYGSEVDLQFPEKNNLKMLVKKGDKTTAGKTVIAKIVN